MASKTLVLLGLFAVLLVVSAEVAAASDTVKSETKESVQPQARCRYGCCYVYKYRPGCSRCCAYAGEAVQTQPGH